MIIPNFVNNNELVIDYIGYTPLTMTHEFKATCGEQSAKIAQPEKDIGIGLIFMLRNKFLEEKK